MSEQAKLKLMSKKAKSEVDIHLFRNKLTEGIELNYCLDLFIFKSNKMELNETPKVCRVIPPPPVNS